MLARPHPVAASSKRSLLAMSALAGLLALGTLAAPSDAEAQHRWLAPRLRFGVSGVGGGFVGDLEGGVGGISPRVGVQLSEHVALMVQGQYLIGRFIDGTGEFAGVAFHAAMVELTAASVFQFGVGPSLDFWWGCDSDPGQVACSRSGPYLGADFRLAIVLGGAYDRTRSRTGFGISLDVHPTLLDADRWGVVGLLGFGGEIY